MKNMNIPALIRAVVVAALLFRGEQPAAARDGTDNNGHMIAVTGQFGSGMSVLYLIDTEEKQLAVYKTVSGNSVEFIAARDIEFDLKMQALNDRSDPELHPKVLKERFLRFNRKKAAATNPKKD